MFKLNPRFLILVAFVIAINAYSCQAAKVIEKCWEGSATGTDLKKTNRMTNETKCDSDTKNCLKWYLHPSKSKNTAIFI